LLEKIGKYLIKQERLADLYSFEQFVWGHSARIPAETLAGKSNTPNQLQELLQQQRVWFLLDGLDEMQAASSVDALNKISQDISKLAAARVVLTCRLNVWDASTKNLLDFPEFQNSGV
jgi:predicted NACHT family NTPase